MSDTTIEVTVNDEPVTLLAQATVTDLVSARCPSPKGIAVARNGEVVARSAWSRTTFAPGDQIEIVSAAAGG